jgi:hypothetical protein
MNICGVVICVLLLCTPATSQVIRICPFLLKSFTHLYGIYCPPPTLLNLLPDHSDLAVCNRVSSASPGHGTANYFDLTFDERNDPRHFHYYFDVKCVRDPESFFPVDLRPFVANEIRIYGPRFHFLEIPILDWFFPYDNENNTIPFPLSFALADLPGSLIRFEVGDVLAPIEMPTFPFKQKLQVCETVTLRI